MPDAIVHPASYKDPSGFVFSWNGLYYRQVNQSYRDDYDLLMQSGLYERLTEQKMLVRHEELAGPIALAGERFKTLLPQQIVPWTLASEWTPGQLKDAGLLTLRIAQTAIEHGLILKDATPYNIQFVNRAPVLIDTLSFERYDPTRPWVAYRQFCECFLFPLFLHHYHQTGTNALLRAYPDGVPATVAEKLLPAKSIFRPGAWMHVFMQSRIHGDGRAGEKQPAFSKKKLQQLIGHLITVVDSLKVMRGRSAWSSYYEKDVLSTEYLQKKQQVFGEMIAHIGFRTALDVGANNGLFSLQIAEKGTQVLAIDSDWPCMESLYTTVKQRSITHVLPLCVDVADPTPLRGFDASSGSAFAARLASDLVVALAVVHHLVFGKNIPLSLLADRLALLAHQHLIIEFVPLSDPKVQELIRHKDRYHAPYDEPSFEKAFSDAFTIERKIKIGESERTLYLMSKKSQV